MKSPNETQELTREAAKRFKLRRIKEDLIPELEKLIDIFPEEVEVNERSLGEAENIEIEIVRTTLPSEVEVQITRTIDGLTVGRVDVSIGNLIALARRAVI